jgi:hypothetical protein
VKRLAGALLALALAAPAAAQDAKDFSPAERALFMSKQLANVRPPATLNYRYARSGSLEPGFDDKVVLQLAARADRSCCAAHVEFLTGERRLDLPDVEAAEGNPVVLYFLERDIREMSRRTKGQAAYFRKRIRMAVYQGAQMRDLQLPFGGRTVAARQVVVSPYLDDPLRPRFEQLAGKRYLFTLSDAVPGGVYALTTVVDGATVGAPPVLAEELLLEGAAPVPRNP